MILNSPELKEMSEENKVILGVSGLVSLLLSFSHDTEEWMNEALAIILKNKKTNDVLKEVVKDFISLFNKTHLKTSNFSGVDLKQEILELL